MLPVSISGNLPYVIMLAITEQREEGLDIHIDNTDKYLLLMLAKLGLDAAVFYICCQKLWASFLSMSSLSILLADTLMVLFMMTVWLIGPERSPVSTCSFLAHASAIYRALPLPMMLLGLLDYCLAETRLHNQSTLCKVLRYAALNLLVWVPVVLYTSVSVKAEPMEVEYKEIKLLVCKVEESALLSYFVLVLFAAVTFSLLPFCQNIPKWLKEADRLSDVRVEQANQRSDLLFTSTGCKEAKSGEEIYTEATSWPRPPLWCSLMLGFGIFWMPYITMSVLCMVCGFGVPAYITVNLLWLECTNSLLVGVVFWAKSNTLGPYSHLPENVCLWHVYWHLSKGTQQQQLPVAVFNPAKGKRNPLFYL